MTRDRRSAVGVLAVVLTVGLGLVLSFVPGARAAVRGFVAPVTAPDPSLLAAQRQAVERSVARGYAKAFDQVHKVATELVLPISREEALLLEQRAVEDLRRIRQGALTDLGARIGLSGPALHAYVRSTEPRLEAEAADGGPGTLLAPELYAIVAKADAQFAQTTDAAVRELTRPRSPSPRPSGP